MDMGRERCETRKRVFSQRSASPSKLAGARNAESGMARTNREIRARIDTPARTNWHLSGNVPEFAPVPDSTRSPCSSWQHCHPPMPRNTMSCMETTLAIRITSDLKRQLDDLSRRTHRSSSELVRESIRRFIASEQIAAVRKMTMPLAEAQGFVTDEDVFKAVS